jgi:MerR family mercuric resistance operon transcriptional regulator
MEAIGTAEAAKRGGVGIETIRYYERHGLMPRAPRTHSGYRIFTEDAVTRLRFIKHAQELGFSLKEIKELLSLRIRPRSSCADVRRRAEAKIAEVEEKIRHLEAMREALSQLARACSGQGPVSSCTIIQALNKEGS